MVQMILMVTLIQMASRITVSLNGNANENHNAD